MASLGASRHVGLSAILILLATFARAEVIDIELAVKATYLYKLAQFVEWPAEALGGSTEPLVICIQGADPFGTVADRAIVGQRLGTHPVSLRRVARLSADSGCQVAYVAGSRTQSVSQALEAVQDQPVLTVTDAARGSPKGIVHLVLSSGKVRFSINAASAQARGLEISSKLLALAVEVGR